MLVHIFIPGGHSSTNVSFLLVHIQDFSCLGCQGWIDVQQPVCQIFVYRTFADTKSSGSLPYGSIMFYDIMCHLYDPLFDGALLIRICFHTPLPILCLYIVCRRRAFYLLLGDFYFFNLTPSQFHLFHYISVLPQNFRHLFCLQPHGSCIFIGMYSDEAGVFPEIPV